MGGLDKRAPFTATGGIIPPEFQNIKTPCYILDEKALIKNAKLLGEVSERTGCKMLLAQKAFSNYDCYRFFEPYLAGTEASGLFEARLGAEEMPGKEVHVFCAGYRADEFERAKELAFLQFEVDEIVQAELKEHEDEELESLYRRMCNGKRIVQSVTESYQYTG